ncbi:hypothetical protein CAL23_15730 [Bordetella genomosp. 6]|uniref:Uncharacterized protein n=1 Tax=Bordetella genomosp. 6 TaxID=463024 RepID=A0ABX4FAN6_9BORD|nr:hypothetical protein CAL23_15730 [Bordetella genomosp. 6]
MENRHLGASRGAFFLGERWQGHQLAAWIGRRLFSPRGGQSAPGDGRICSAAGASRWAAVFVPPSSMQRPRAIAQPFKGKYL